MQDLQNHLFSQLEKIIQEDLTGDELKEELNRAKGVTEVSKVILESVDLQIRAEESLTGMLRKPKMLE